MDSLRSTHARVAALSRRRLPDDPELAEARQELATRLEQIREARVRLGSLDPEAWARPTAGEDESARQALERVVQLATRWTRLPGRRQAGISVLAAVKNQEARARV